MWFCLTIKNHKYEDNKIHPCKGVPGWAVMEAHTCEATATSKINNISTIPKFLLAPLQYILLLRPSLLICCPP